jgi:putative transposase
VLDAGATAADHRPIGPAPQTPAPGISTTPADRLAAEHPDHVWALDYQFDHTTDGRILKLLNVVNEHPREALTITVDRRLDADTTVAVLDGLVAERGTVPRFIRCDNGPELTANALRNWCRFNQAETSYIEPGSPWQNPYVESFGGRLRDELLAVEAFSSPQARNLLLVLGERGRRISYLLHDRDAKFTRSFDDVFRSEGAKVLLTRIQAPNANAMPSAGSARSAPSVSTGSWSSYDVTWSRSSGSMAPHYNTYRPHRALGLEPPDPSAHLRVVRDGQPSWVHRRDLLAGLLHEYHRRAA